MPEQKPGRVWARWGPVAALVSMLAIGCGAEELPAGDEAETLDEAVLAEEVPSDDDGVEASWGREKESALEFGSQGTSTFVFVPSMSQFPLGGDLTLEFWLKTSSSFGGGNWHDAEWILDKDIPGVGLPDWAVVAHSGRIVFDHGNPGGADDLPVFSSRTINDGRWHHVAITRSQRTGKVIIYIDGKKDTEVLRPTSFIGNSETLTIGHENAGNAFFERAFKGRLDDIRIWSRVRSQSEIRKDMKGCDPGHHKKYLVAWWRFDEGSGQVARDSTRNDNDGQLGATPEPDAADPLWVPGKRKHQKDDDRLMQEAALAPPGGGD